MFLNTFASERLVLEEKSQQFIIENASSLTIKKNVKLLKLSYKKNSCVKFDAFSRRNGSFFPQKRGAEKGRC